LLAGIDVWIVDAASPSALVAVVEVGRLGGIDDQLHSRRRKREVAPREGMLSVIGESNLNGA
jgi:hypothetical protein